MDSRLFVDETTLRKPVSVGQLGVNVYFRLQAAEPSAQASSETVQKAPVSVGEPGGTVYFRLFSQNYVQRYPQPRELTGWGPRLNEPGLAHADAEVTVTIRHIIHIYKYDRFAE